MSLRLFLAHSETRKFLRQAIVFLLGLCVGWVVFLDNDFAVLVFVFGWSAGWLSATLVWCSMDEPDEAD